MRLFHNSVCCVSPKPAGEAEVLRNQLAHFHMKKCSAVFTGILLTLIGLTGLATAAAEWQQIGEIAAGGRVSVSSVRILKNNMRTAWVRIEYKEPTRLPQGGPFIELRARVRFNCGSGGAVPSAEWLYARDRSGKLVVSKKARRDDEFGRESEGGFGEMASRYVCRQVK